MMDIETATWRIQSHATPGATLTNKKTGQSKYIPGDHVPHASYLAQITERQMDKEMQELFNSGSGEDD